MAFSTAFIPSLPWSGIRLSPLCPRNSLLLVTFSVTPVDTPWPSQILSLHHSRESHSSGFQIWFSSFLFGLFFFPVGVLQDLPLGCPTHTYLYVLESLSLTLS